MTRHPVFPALLSLAFAFSAHAGDLLSGQKTSFHKATASWRDQKLTVSTGPLTRVWTWTGHGLATTKLTTPRGETTAGAPPAADWSHPGLLRDDSRAELISLVAEESDDQGFTSKHLAVTAVISYPEEGLTCRYSIWAYPGVEGMRTQLEWKGQAAGAQARGDGPTFKVLQGTPYTNPEALKVASKREASTLHHRENVILQLSGLEPGTPYTLDVTWWDFGGGGRTQSLTITSVDGESSVQPILPTRIPGWLNGKNKKPQTLTTTIPANLNIDGSVKLIITNHEGPSVSVSALALFAADAKGPERKALASLDCGAKSASEGVRQADANVDRIPLRGLRNPGYHAMGFYNDTQHRHRAKDHLLKEEAVSAPATVSWANALFVEGPRQGLALVKESHKCVNQAGVRTGAFVLDSSSLVNTGWALAPGDIKSDSFSWCWASWLIAYDTSQKRNRALALKAFDRTRYLVHRKRDMYLKANTWGSDTAKVDSQSRAQESEILAELESVADLGLDSLQIDDGWQMPLKPRGSMPPRSNGWYPHPERWPRGWQPVVDKSRELGVHLGIWAAAQPISLKEMKENYDQAHFTTWKLDFARLNSQPALAAMLDKGRSFVGYTDHRAQITWDVTENAPRYGYFWARECGCIWLANRKPISPPNVVPKPWLVLREAWELAHYAPMSKFQLPIQNFSRVNRDVSDAHKHPETYAVALGLAGVPVFFQTTRLYTPGQRAQIKPLIKTYKSVRNDLFDRFVLPVGSEPDNKSWAGFQWLHPDHSDGYLLLFRERLNEDTHQSFPLHGLEDLKDYSFTDLLTGKPASPPFHIPRAPGILFLRYQPKGS